MVYIMVKRMPYTGHMGRLEQKVIQIGKGRTGFGNRVLEASLGLMAAISSE